MKRKPVLLAIAELGSLFLVMCGARFLLMESAWEGFLLSVSRALTLSLCCAISFYYFDLYNLRAVWSFTVFFARFVWALVVAFALLAVLYFCLPEAAVDGHPFFSDVHHLDLLVAIAVLIPIRGVFYLLMRNRRFAERVLILGTSPLARSIAGEIEASPLSGYAIVGFVDDHAPASTRGLQSLYYPLYGPLEKLDQIIDEVKPDRIIVALTERRGRLPARSLLDARMAGVIVEDGIAVHERFTGKLAIESLTPSYLIYSKDFTKPKIQTALRRIISWTCAVIGLIITAPLLFLIAVAIKLDSKGSVFFIQERAGLGGRTFRLVKFRTMHPASPKEETGSIWDRDVTSRITRVGKWLRKLRLDELPQCINILRGDMDLVGPRPEMATNVKTMSEQIPYYSLRMVVRPGITGWAQIRHGYSVSEEDVTEKMRYDLYYVKHLSLWFDLRILVDTVKIVLLGSGSEVSTPSTDESNPSERSESNLRLLHSTPRNIRYSEKSEFLS